MVMSSAPGLRLLLETLVATNSRHTALRTLVSAVLHVELATKEAPPTEGEWDEEEEEEGEEFDTYGEYDDEEEEGQTATATITVTHNEEGEEDTTHGDGGLATDEEAADAATPQTASSAVHYLSSGEESTPPPRSPSPSSPPRTRRKPRNNKSQQGKRPPRPKRSSRRPSVVSGGTDLATTTGGGGSRRPPLSSSSRAGEEPTTEEEPVNGSRPFYGGGGIDLWKSRMPVLTPTPFAATSAEPIKAASGGRQAGRPPTAGSRPYGTGGSSTRTSSRPRTPLVGRSVSVGSTLYPPRPALSATAQQSVEAKSRLGKVSADRRFWSNRLQLLHRQVAKAQLDLDRARTQDTAASVATVLTESVEAQLELEKRRVEHQRAEKRRQIQIQTLEHKVASRAAFRRILDAKQQTGQQHRSERSAFQEEVEQRRREDAEAKARQRAAVQHDKVHSMVSRVRSKALRQEEARLAHEARVEELRRQAEVEEAALAQSVVQSSNLVDRVRALKALKREAEASRAAQRALAVGVYRDG